jgi:hypothetical protein
MSGYQQEPVLFWQLGYAASPRHPRRLETVFRGARAYQVLPDDVARQIARVFNTNDTFNQGMLLDWVSTCATGVAYDEKLLRTCKSASQLLFNAVPGIMKHRYVWIVSDDGSVQQLQAGDHGCVDEVNLEKRFNL